MNPRAPTRRIGAAKALVHPLLQAPMAAAESEAPGPAPCPVQHGLTAPMRKIAVALLGGDGEPCVRPGA
jgi:hypothetical protein